MGSGGGGGGEGSPPDLYLSSFSRAHLAPHFFLSYFLSQISLPVHRTRPVVFSFSFSYHLPRPLSSPPPSTLPPSRLPSIFTLQFNLYMQEVYSIISDPHNSRIFKGIKGVNFRHVLAEGSGGDRQLVEVEQVRRGGGLKTPSFLSHAPVFLLFFFLIFFSV
jgi:hypothetical protein